MPYLAHLNLWKIARGAGLSTQAEAAAWLRGSGFRPTVHAVNVFYCGFDPRPILLPGELERLEECAGPVGNCAKPTSPDDPADDRRSCRCRPRYRARKEFA